MVNTVIRCRGGRVPDKATRTRSRSWCPSAIRTILHNVRYTGKVVWSRKHEVRDLKTGRRVFRSKQGELPVEGADCPHLRIFSDRRRRVLRIENGLTDEHGDDVRLKKGTHVEVTISSEPKAVKHEV